MRKTFSILLISTLALAPFSFAGCNRHEEETSKTSVSPNGDTSTDKTTKTVDNNGNTTVTKEKETNNP